MVFSEIKRCQYPQFTQIVQKAKKQVKGHLGTWETGHVPSPNDDIDEPLTEEENRAALITQRGGGWLVGISKL